MIEEIKALKELLDMGAITQEEFDAKKKQLLGIPDQHAQAQPQMQPSGGQPAAPSAQPQAQAAGFAQPEYGQAPVPSTLAVPASYGQAPCAPAPVAYEKSKVAAGLLALFLGALGIHKFYLGYTTQGVIMILCTVLGALLIVGPFVMGIISLVEGIIYLTKTDADFDAIYVKGNKGWF